MYNNYYQPQYQQPTRQIPALKGRPVSSIEEARASAVDFDGSVFYFPDLANKKIYTKQINLDGTASLLMYELKEIPIEEAPSYVTRQEFDTTINSILAAMAPKEPEPQVQNPKPAVPQIEYKF